MHCLAGSDKRFGPVFVIAPPHCEQTAWRGASFGLLFHHFQISHYCTIIKAILCHELSQKDTWLGWYMEKPLT